MKNPQNNISFLILFLLISLSCNDNKCIEGRMLNVEFHYFNSGNVEIQNPYDSIKGFGGDTAFSSGEFYSDWDERYDVISKIRYTHLNPHSDRTTFLFYNSISKDTIELSYKREDKYQSADCNLYLKITELKTERSSFVSTSIYSSEPFKINLFLK